MSSARRASKQDCRLRSVGATFECSDKSLTIARKNAPKTRFHGWVAGVIHSLSQGPYLRAGTDFSKCGVLFADGVGEPIDCCKGVLSGFAFAQHRAKVFHFQLDQSV